MRAHRPRPRRTVGKRPQLRFPQAPSYRPKRPLPLLTKRTLTHSPKRLVQDMAPTRTLPDPQATPTPEAPLPMPHERDETSGPGSTASGEPTEVMDQARKDIEAGQVDTDMRSTSGLDALERKRLVPTPTRPPKT